MKNLFKDVALFIFEIGKLKHLPRSGWRNIGVENPVSVAGHQLRSAQLAYILAEMEGGVDSEKVCCMMVVHDNAETRIGDFDKIASMYLPKKEAEAKAFSDQLDLLPEKIKQKWSGYFDEFENGITKEAVIAKDADLLEMAFQAKHYHDLGHPIGRWIERVEESLQTNSAKEILKELKETNFIEWSQVVYKKALD